MRQIYLLARREYLAFVSAWSFWVSLLILPVLMGLSITMPAIVQQTQPTRYYAVVTDDPSLEAAFTAHFQKRRDDALEDVVRAAARLRSADEELERRALAAYAEAESPEAGLAAAAEELGLPGASAFDIPRFPMARVDPPAREPGALRPYLLGDATIETPEGPRPLYAAVFLRRDAESGVAIDYWSAALTNRTLINLTEDAMRDLLRAEALTAAGVPLDAVERADDVEPSLTELNPEREGAEAQVTLADRLPYLMGAGLAFSLWMAIFTGAGFLLNGVIEEKSAKILEALLASARYHEILVAKLLAVAGVSGTMMLFWGGFAAASLAPAMSAGVSWPAEVISTLLDPGLLIPFAAFFVLGYLMFGSIYAAVGSLCDTIQEAHTLMMPMMFVTLPPMFMTWVALIAPDSPALAIMSWIPFYTPFLMMMRLPAGVPLWEVAVTLALTAAFAALVLWAAGRVFRAGVVGGAKADSVKRVFGRLGRRPAALAGASEA